MVNGRKGETPKETNPPLAMLGGRLGGWAAPGPGHTAAKVGNIDAVLSLSVSVGTIRRAIHFTRHKCVLVCVSMGVCVDVCVDVCVWMCVCGCVDVDVGGGG